MKKLAIILLFFTHISLYGQTVDLTQFYASPLYLNPAYAGSEGTHRIATLYRSPTDDNLSSSTFFLASYDGMFNHNNSHSTEFAVTYGVNMSNTNLRFLDGSGFNTTSISGGIGARNNTISFGVQANLTQYGFDLGNNLIYHDQLTDYGLLSKQKTDDLYAIESLIDYHIDFNVGLLFHPSPNFLLGMSAKNMAYLARRDKETNGIRMPESEATVHGLYNIHYGLFLESYTYRKDGLGNGNFAYLQNLSNTVWVGPNLKVRHFGETSYASGVFSILLRFSLDLYENKGLNKFSNENRSSPLDISVSIDIADKSISGSDKVAFINNAIEISLTYVIDKKNNGDVICPSFRAPSKGSSKMKPLKKKKSKTPKQKGGSNLRY